MGEDDLDFEYDDFGYFCTDDSADEEFERSRELDEEPYMNGRKKRTIFQVGIDE